MTMHGSHNQQLWVEPVVDLIIARVRVIEALFPERVPQRAAIADHHIRGVPDLLALLELACHAS